MKVEVEIPAGDKCYIDTPRYVCPFWCTRQFDLSVVSRCGYLQKDWTTAGCVANPQDYQKHPDCPALQAVRTEGG